MCNRFGIVLISLLLLGSCAVVEPLTGGDPDENAPIPSLSEMQPANGSTNFTGKEIRIPFDEFFVLNNPSENIIVIPPDIKPKAKIKNKTLVLSWDEEMKPNTTYAFYLNGAVQDFTEKNDSLMSFVFSTGANIDSLTVIFDVRSAYEQAPLPNQTLGFYTSFSDSVLPNYFAKTNKEGKAELKYMKAGVYEVVAFEDNNKNLKHDRGEAFGFKLEKLNLLQSYVDSTPILISPPEEKPKITTVKLIPPHTFIVAANRNLENAKYRLNGVMLNDENLVAFADDSVLLSFQWTDSANYEIIVETNEWSDTSSFRMQQKDKTAAFNLTPIKTENVFSNEPIRFLSNHVITSLDTPKVLLKNPKDSSFIPKRSIQLRDTKVELDFTRTEDVKEVEVVFLPFSIQTASGTNSDTLSYRIKVLTEKEVGSLTIQLAGFDSALILDLISKGNLMARIPLKIGTASYTFINLLPGEYSFRVTEDENGNGRWDGGNWQQRILPEKVYPFLKSNRVRGNWDTEITLEKDGI